MSPRRNKPIATAWRVSGATLAMSALLTLSARAGSNELLVIPPAQLPVAARASAEGMLLHQTIDGRALLYLERQHGSTLAVFDVTDPKYVTSKGMQTLPAADAFDFLRSLSDMQELVRYRHSRNLAVLDLRHDLHPTLRTLQPGALDATITASPAYALPGETGQVRDFRIVDGTDPSSSIEVPAVSAQQVNEITGTTFLLATEGLYEIRRPSIEADHAARTVEALE